VIGKHLARLEEAEQHCVSNDALQQIAQINKEYYFEKGRQKKFMVLTYGCQMNEHDSEVIAGFLYSAGYIETTELTDADLVVLNTCCVRESAENKIYGKIGSLKNYKKCNPEMLVAVGGCMAQKEKEAIQKRAPHVDLVFGTHNLHQLPELLLRVIQNKAGLTVVWEDAAEIVPTMPIRRKGGFKAWVSITYGCNNFCSYCIVPYVRGRERSRELAEIVADVQGLAKDGFKEITLLGQNVNSYGKDLPHQQDFADLLVALDKIDGIERIRFMTSHPRDMSEKVIMAIRDGKKICEHIHLPIQAGSNHILAKMNRGYTAEDYVKLVERIRHQIPGVSITTDIIVGFPGETEADFNQTLEIVKTVQFDMAYTFMFSPRSGTPAATMADQLPINIKKERLQRLMEIQSEISKKANEKLIGQVVEVLVDGSSKNNPAFFSGRTRTNKIIIFKGESKLTGKIVNVKVNKAQSWNLYGELVNCEE